MGFRANKFILKKDEYVHPKGLITLLEECFNLGDSAFTMAMQPSEGRVME
jgi:hypothetical protein